MSAYGCCDEYNEHAETCPFRSVGVDKNGYSISYLDRLESRLAEREKELADAKELSELRLKSEQKHVWENLRYREALEKFTDLACGDHESHDPHGWAKAALGEKRHLERRDEGEGA